MIEKIEQQDYPYWEGMSKVEKSNWESNIETAKRIADNEGKMKELIESAYEIGGDYVTTYWGCAQSTYLATIDTLRNKEIEILTKKDEQKIFPALVGMAGGAGNVGVGSCGAFTGTAFLISLTSLRSQGITRKVQESNINHRWIAFDAVYRYTVKRFLGEYNGLSCRDVTWARFGKQYDSWDPKAKAEFAREEKERGCIDDTAGYPCTIARAVAWAVEDIIDILINPITLNQVIKEHELE